MNESDKQMATQIFGPNVTNQMIQDAIYNEYRLRTRMLSMFFDPRRDIEKECGYPNPAELTCDDYRKLYDGEPIARRVVNLYPRECWRKVPWVGESEKTDSLTPFDTGLIDVVKGLSGTSFFKAKEGEGNKIWWYLQKVDELSGIGRFGILVFGFDDGKPLQEPIELNPDGFPSVRRKLLFLRALDETQAKVIDTDRNENSTRFGLPTMYEVTAPKVSANDTAGTEQFTTYRVHWTRVLHVCDGSELYSQSRLQVPYKRLYDLYKLYGGSAEMYWKGAFFGLSIETQPEMLGKVKPLDNQEKAWIKRQLEQYTQGLDRTLLMGNMSAKTLAPQVVDPSKHIDGQIQAICIDLACPIRVFMGSERGELSSEQDSDEWAGRVCARNNTHTTPNLVVPFHDRLIAVGCVPAPVEYFCSWSEDKAKVNPVEQANIALARTQAMAAYVGGNVVELMEPRDYLTRELGYSEDEADAILENRMEGLRLEDSAVEDKEWEAEQAEEEARRTDEQSADSRDFNTRKLDIEELKAKAARKPA